MEDASSRPMAQYVKVPAKPTQTQVAAAMKESGLPSETVWQVYRAMIEVAERDLKNHLPD